MQLFWSRRTLYRAERKRLNFQINPEMNKWDLDRIDRSENKSANASQLPCFTFMGLWVSVVAFPKTPVPAVPNPAFPPNKLILHPRRSQGAPDEKVDTPAD